MTKKKTKIKIATYTYNACCYNNITVESVTFGSVGNFNCDRSDAYLFHKWNFVLLSHRYRKHVPMRLYFHRLSKQNSHLFQLLLCICNIFQSTLNFCTSKIIFVQQIKSNTSVYVMHLSDIALRLLFTFDYIQLVVASKSGGWKKTICMFISSWMGTEACESC